MIVNSVKHTNAACLNLLYSCKMYIKNDWDHERCISIRPFTTGPRRESVRHCHQSYKASLLLSKLWGNGSLTWVVNYMQDWFFFLNLCFFLMFGVQNNQLNMVRFSYTFNGIKLISQFLRLCKKTSVVFLFARYIKKKK